MADIDDRNPIINNGRGLVVGTPTGGELGPGTVNTAGIYVNGVPVSGGLAVPSADLIGGTGTILTSITLAAGLTLEQGRLSADIVSVAGRIGEIELTSDDIAGLGPLATTPVGTAVAAQVEAGRIFQRTSRTGGANNLGQALVPISVTVTGGAVQYTEYQLRNASGGAVIQAWAPLSGALAPGAQTLLAPVPAFLGWYLLDFRANGANPTLGTGRFAVGELVGIAGQSIAQTFINTSVTGDATTLASLGITVSPYAGALVYYASNGGGFPAVPDGPDQNFPPAWQTPGDGTPINGSAVATFLNLMIAAWGVPCGVIGYVVGGTGIATWLPGYSGTGSPHSAKLKAILNRAGGTFGAFFWDQGHYETKDGNTQAQFTAQLSRLFADLAQSFPAAAALQFKRVIGTIPAIGNYGNGPVACDNVRGWAKDWADGAPDAVVFDGLDITLAADLVHPSQAGGIIFGRHVYRALANAHGLLTFGDAGPLIRGASRAYGSTEIDLAVAQVNAGTLFVVVGAPATQFRVFPAGQTTGALAISSVDTSNPAMIKIILAAAPTEPAALDVYYRLPPDTPAIIAAGIYDAVTDPDGLTSGRQLALVPRAISVSAPMLGLVVGTIADTTAGTAITVSGAYTSAPTALDYSTDSGATWTAAPSPTIGSGVFTFVLSSGVPVGTYIMMVRDHNVPAIIGASGIFTAALASPPTLPAIASPIFAMDAANVVGSFFTDSAMTQQAANGQKIAGIKDASAGGNNFVQAVPGLQPTLTTNVKNAMPGLRFTGSAQQLMNQVSGTISSTMKASAGYGSLVVFTPATLPSVAQDTLSIGTQVTNGYDKVRLVQQLASGVSRTSRNADPTVTTAAVLGTATSANTLIKAVSRYDGTNIKIAANAIAEASAVVTGAFANAWTETSVLGASNDGGSGTEFYLDGWIHEIRVWNTALTDTNRADLLTYATAKWGN